MVFYEDFVAASVFTYLEPLMQLICNSKRNFFESIIISLFYKYIGWLLFVGERRLRMRLIHSESQPLCR